MDASELIKQKVCYQDQFIKAYLKDLKPKYPINVYFKYP